MSNSIDSQKENINSNKGQKTGIASFLTNRGQAQNDENVPPQHNGANMPKGITAKNGYPKPPASASSSQNPPPQGSKNTNPLLNTMGNNSN